MLEVNSINTFYGQSQVLFGMSLKIAAGEVVTLMGRNGMGKTTTVRSIMGLTAAQSGEILFEGTNITALPSYKIARLGIGLVPEGRLISPNLDVLENLVATAYVGRDGKGNWSLDRVLELFPRLRERKTSMGNQLSGGEQQMLAIARALMTNPELLILDEATEGLAPLIREEIWTCLAGLKQEGQSILVIDKNVQALSKFADRHYIMEKGQVVWEGNSTSLVEDDEVKYKYLGI
ncbi:ABC transporter ATP-binding protein [Sneathiella marina]|uniref:ABC transporter ATP-binding protein n=1 Tax=Sneathiella marina TaxID=2950108 RepID=A0ABY4VXL7_9PROT|nr:ABC transporter ATP-binding protein [Sneathiella marina]USG59667.1 ABC transporter ATP-binding protein [Sneathiella marina]